MNRILTGQVLLVFCCVVYMIWWFRGFRPGTQVSRAGGVNGLLLLITAALGIAGIFFSLTQVPLNGQMKVGQMTVVIAGIVVYIALLLITKFCFNRIVTAELFLIIGWTMLEMIVIYRLNSAGFLGEPGFVIMCAVMACAFITSMILYVAYYRMEEMKAFYAAMVPLVTEAVSMIVLIMIVLAGKG